MLGNSLPLTLISLRRLALSSPYLWLDSPSGSSLMPTRKKMFLYKEFSFPSECGRAEYEGS
jgi:hypothetical protein